MSHFQIEGYVSVCIEVLVTRVRQIQSHIKLGYVRSKPKQNQGVGSYFLRMRMRSGFW